MNKKIERCLECLRKLYQGDKESSDDPEEIEARVCGDCTCPLEKGFLDSRLK
ncbi:MAG: hypothetical protein KGY76_04940 [Candidatus Thermoplasmatota archaeon]|nr:hypothetical protein [Candidatus Thermoplasmatota archaeon]